MYSTQYSLDKDEKTKKRMVIRFGWRHFILIGAIIITIIILINIYQLYHLSHKLFGDTPFHATSSDVQKAAWIFAKKSSHLQHVIRILRLAGYSVITSLTPPPRWDLMWAYDFPFKKEFKDMLTNLKFHQKVNHLPGTGMITLKVELATTKLKWIPQAFSIPKEKEEFLQATKLNPQALWVQKSNNHRGIKIVKAIEMDLEAQSTFIQEFVQKPLLIDGKKFDIGMYVVYTSVDPLQVYIYEDEILIRFCTIDYTPLKVEQVEKYVVGDDYINIADMPSLKSYIGLGKMSNKNALFTYLTENGYDVKNIWAEISKCIGEMFIAKADSMEKSFAGYRTKHNFFEMVRVDFVLDDAGKVWLMEVNMSPNLASSSHPNNAIMYEQVIYNTLSLAGAADHVDDRFDHETKNVVVSDRDIVIPNHKCILKDCLDCSIAECRLCNHCLSDVEKTYIQKAYREHMNKGGFLRVLPSPLHQGSRESIYKDFKTTGQLNVVLEQWFKEKCKLRPSFCQ